MQTKALLALEFLLLGAQDCPAGLVVLIPSERRQVMEVLHQAHQLVRLAACHREHRPCVERRAQVGSAPVPESGSELEQIPILCRLDKNMSQGDYKFIHMCRLPFNKFQSYT